MTVSFVIIAFNEERSIARCIDSIVSQTGLTKFEVVVVSDGSTDKTVEIVQNYAKKDKHVKLVDLVTNQGRGAARAAGVNAATGDYLAFIDADIVLPKNWLGDCLQAMSDDVDMCGGIAVPDGDVSLVHRWFNLHPKVAPHSTTVTGSNGLFRKRVFDVIHFNANKKNGEDVDLGYQIEANNLHGITVPGLVVDHREMKNYRESIVWLFQTGIGASRQFYEHHEIRLPDIAFAGFVLLSIAGIATGIVTNLNVLIIIATVLAYLGASSAMHLYTKFHLQKNVVNSVGAVLTNITLLGSYYIGRMLGMVTQWRNSA